jgi:sugar O-acyltransferase (sialic acid O-acetyltransferase NeuD family)
MKKVALIGYSGHAFVVIDTFQQSGFEITGYFERIISQNNPYHLDYLGFEQNPDFINIAKDYYLFPAIGDNNIRQKLIKLLIDNNLLIGTAIHPKANISKFSEINKGTLVCQGACINPFAKIGLGVIINTSAIIEHECIVGNYSHIAPGAVLTGNVTVGYNTFIGANSVIKQGVNIGNNVIIGAGSVVLNDIPNDTKWIGNPAKISLT